MSCDYGKSFVLYVIVFRRYKFQFEGRSFKLNFCILQATLANTEMTTMKSRHQREVGELKEQLHRANMASERDQALREKVFNEAKVEVMALSKKVL